MRRIINKNFIQLRKTYLENKQKGIILEGSSRSGKTISSIDFIIWLSTIEHGMVINLVRETYNSFKTTLYNDISNRLKAFGITSPFDNTKEVSTFKIFDNKINFIGADKPSKFEGAGADIWYFNELLDIPQMIFDLAEMRCRRFWIGDYNPKFVNHWVFNRILNRPDVNYCHSTFLDNPFISKIEREKILSYQPTEENKINGTVDAYMWNVYGLGLRCVSDHIVFRNWQECDSMPDDYELKVYGMDFGYMADPSTLIEIRVVGNNLYCKELLYKHGLLNKDIYENIKDIIDYNTYIVADSAEPKSIVELRILGLPIIEATKGPDSIKYGVNKILQYNLFIDKNSLKLQNEIRNYQYMIDKQGNVLNIPVDKDNHLIDPLRYALTKFVR